MCEGVKWRYWWRGAEMTLTWHLEGFTQGYRDHGSEMDRGSCVQG
jgi:hypothetical protein